MRDPHRRCPERHVSQLYRRMLSKERPKAIGTVAKHLAEAAFDVLRGANRFIEIQHWTDAAPTRDKRDFVVIPALAGSRNECDTLANNSMPQLEDEEMTR
jgi:hypothetical protein